MMALVVVKPGLGVIIVLAAGFQQLVIKPSADKKALMLAGALFPFAAVAAVTIKGYDGVVSAVQIPAPVVITLFYFFNLKKN
jgi:hypothetical protein